jgi:outer membrane protein
MRKFATAAIATTLCLVTAGLWAQAKIAVVDTVKVATQCKEGKKIQATLKSFHDQKQTDITAKEAELKALEEKTKDPKISDDKKDEARNLFNQKMYEYQAYAKAAQDEMDSRTQKAQSDLQQKMAGVIEKYAQAKGFALVVEKSICLYNAEALDVTDDVIAAMNQAFPGN